MQRIQFCPFSTLYGIVPQRISGADRKKVHKTTYFQGDSRIKKYLTGLLTMKNYRIFEIRIIVFRSLHIVNIKFVRAYSYGKKLSRLARKHFDLPNNFVLFIWTVFPLSGKVLNKLRSYGTNIFPCIGISPINKRDLCTRENFLSHMNVK